MALFSGRVFASAVVLCLLCGNTNAQQDQQQDQQQQQQQQQLCTNNAEPCADIYQPLCGTDGTSYANECEFTLAQCQDQALQVKSQGACIAKGIFDGGILDDDDNNNNSDDDDSEDLFWLLTLLALPLALFYFCCRGGRGCGGGCGRGGGCGMMPYYGGGCGGGMICC